MFSLQIKKKIKMKKSITFIAAMLGLGITVGKAQTAALQVIHNCADPAAATVDIYAGNTLLIDNLNFRFASATFTSIPSGTNIVIGVAPGTSTNANQAIATFTVNFAANSRNIVVADGIVTPGNGFNPSSMTRPFTLATYTSAIAAAPNVTTTSILVHHGSTDAPTVDVVAPFTGTNPVIPNILVNNASYGAFAGYVNLPTANYKLQVRDQFSENVVQEYSAPLQALNLGGAPITVVASGFLNPAQNSNSTNTFGLWVATSAAGSLIPLPTSTTTSTRLQAIHNCADALASTVDVWFRSATTGTAAVLLLDNFAFRTASPYIDVPTAQTVTLSVAPATSTNVSQAIANFTYNLMASAKYQLIASGIVSPAGYTPNNTVAPFTMVANAAVKERAVNTNSTEVLIFHGATDAPAVNIVSPPSTTLATNLTYGTYNSLGYNVLPTANYPINVNSGTTTVAAYTAPLSSLNLQGAAITVLASGFLNPANNSTGPAFGLWAATATGGSLIPLPTLTITSISENNSLSTNLSVYPNPFTTELSIANVSALNLNVVITDLTGKTVSSFVSKESKISVNTAELQNGVYILSVSNDKNKATYKIVK